MQTICKRYIINTAKSPGSVENYLLMSDWNLGSVMLFGHIYLEYKSTQKLWVGR